MYNSNNATTTTTTTTTNTSNTTAQPTSSTSSSTAVNNMNSNGYMNLSSATMANQFSQSSYYYNTNNRYGLSDFSAEDLTLSDLDFLLANNNNTANSQSSRHRQNHLQHPAYSNQHHHQTNKSSSAVVNNVARPPPLTTPAITSFNLLNSLLPLSHTDQIFSNMNNQNNAGSSQQQQQQQQLHSAAHSVASSSSSGDSMTNTASTNSSNDLPNVDLSGTDLDYILDYNIEQHQQQQQQQQPTTNTSSSLVSNSSISMNVYPPMNTKQQDTQQQSSLTNQMHNLSTSSSTSNGYSSPQHQQQQQQYQKKQRMPTSSSSSISVTTSASPMTYHGSISNGNSFVVGDTKTYSTLTNNNNNNSTTGGGGSHMMDYHTRCLPNGGLVVVDSTASTNPTKKFKVENNNLSQYVNNCNSQNVMPQYANNAYMGGVYDSSASSLSSPQLLSQSPSTPPATTNSGSSSSSKTSVHKCWVCGDGSSGNHYGALTCEACKLFFRRHSNFYNNGTASSSTNNTSVSNLTNQQQPSASTSPSSSSSSQNPNNNSSNQSQPACAQRGCQITPQSRSNCPDCRYRKCIAVGMGLSRTTYGRHTSVQKSRYNLKSTDLSGDILKLFDSLKNRLDAKLLDERHLHSMHLPDLLLIPNVSDNSTSSNKQQFRLSKHTANNSFTTHQITSRAELEQGICKFYNDAIELIQPSAYLTGGTSRQSDGSTRSPFAIDPSRIPFNILVTFCLLFGYNLLDNEFGYFATSSSLSNGTSHHPLRPLDMNNICVKNRAQIKHIMKQLGQLDLQYNKFSTRIKVVYFLLIIYTSWSINSLGASSNTSSNPSTSSSIAAAAQSDDFFSYSNTDETNEIQRTLLDLLNSELFDFRSSSVSNIRVSLLLKLDQFI